MRRAAKVDSNHGEVVQALRNEGCFVQSLAALGKGVPDLLVSTPYMSKRKAWLLMEVKSEKGDLTPDQARWIATCQSPVHVVHSAEEALEVVRNA